MRAQEGTARRYAKALHMAATEAGAGEATGRKLAALLEGLEGNQQAMDVLARPWIKPSGRPPPAPELRALLEGLKGNQQAIDVLARPWIKPSDRHAAALELAKKAGCGKLVSDFVALVAERGRMNHLAAIVAAYRALERPP